MRQESAKCAKSLWEIFQGRWGCGEEIGKTFNAGTEDRRVGACVQRSV